MLLVLPVKEGTNPRQGILQSLGEELKRAGKSGRYIKVLNCDSEYGLSFETRGRECVLVTPKSVSNSANGLDFIELPRSA